MRIFYLELCPDELLYSDDARYVKRLKFLHEKGLLREILNNSTTKIIFDLPCGLESYLDNLPFNHRYTSQFLIDNATLFPIYGPFLSLERAEEIISDMKYGDGKTIHLKLGNISTQVKRLPYLQFCPICFHENRTRYGFAYWHRSHNALGVCVCHKHGVFLIKSHIPSQGLMKFFALDDYVFDSSPEFLDLSLQEHQDCLFIAQQMAWLLANHLPALGNEYFRQRYLEKLAEIGLATHSGQVRVKMLNQAFNERFSHEFLLSLNCEIEGHTQRNWLIRFLQGEQVQSPLWHVLLSLFLGLSLEEIIESPADHRPFGEGFWPCLNKICGAYKRLVIEQVHLGCSPNSHRRPLGTFKCPICEFTYSRVGPDTTPEDLYRIGRVVSYGKLWEGKLYEYFEEKLPIKLIAKHLQVHPDTVKLQAARRGLIETPPHLILKISPDASRFRELDLEQAKQDWLETLESNPQADLAQLIEEFYQIYWTIYRLDLAWLENHKPDPNRKGRIVEPSRVDWDSRDLEILSQLPICINEISSRIPLVRLTYSAVAQSLGYSENYFQKNKKKLKGSFAYLAKVVENHEVFALRRIEYIATRYRAEKIFPTSPAFIKRAGLSKAIQSTKILEVINQKIKNLLL